MSSMLGKGFALILFVAFLGVVGSMTVLGTNGSLVIYNVTSAIVDWSTLIGMGVGIGLMLVFLPIAKKKLGL